MGLSKYSSPHPTSDVSPAYLSPIQIPAFRRCLQGFLGPPPQLIIRARRGPSEMELRGGRFQQSPLSIDHGSGALGLTCVLELPGGHLKCIWTSRSLPWSLIRSVSRGKRSDVRKSPGRVRAAMPGATGCMCLDLCGSATLPDRLVDFDSWPLSVTSSHSAWNWGCWERRLTVPATGTHRLISGHEINRKGILFFLFSSGWK